MKGSYRIKQDGVVIREVDNMLTTNASIVILRFLSGLDNAWASAVAIGCGDSPPTPEDRELEFEVGRGNVEIRTPDHLNNAVLVKATIPRGVVGKIHEIGLFNSVLTSANEEDPMLVSDFDPDTMDVEDIEPVEMRIGHHGSSINVSDTREIRFSDVAIDISAIGSSDQMVLAYDADGISQVEIRFMNNEDDYIRYAFEPNTGYNIHRWNVGDFSSVAGGTIQEPFSEMRVIVTASAGGGNLSLDGLRIDDRDIFGNQMLVSRALLDEPINKTNSSELEVEYSIQFNF